MAPPVRRILFAAAVALCIGLTAVVLFAGWSADPTVKAMETLAVVGAVAAVLFGLFGLVGMRLADYREPESEEEFENGVLRAERLARRGAAPQPGGAGGLGLEP